MFNFFLLKKNPHEDNIIQSTVFAFKHNKTILTEKKKISKSHWNNSR